MTPNCSSRRSASTITRVFSNNKPSSSSNCCSARTAAEASAEKMPSTSSRARPISGPNTLSASCCSASRRPAIVDCKSSISLNKAFWSASAPFFIDSNNARKRPGSSASNASLILFNSGRSPSFKSPKLLICAFNPAFISKPTCFAKRCASL